MPVTHNVELYVGYGVPYDSPWRKNLSLIEQERKAKKML